MVQSTTSTPENNWSPAEESNLLEYEPIIVDTVMMPTTGDLDGEINLVGEFLLYSFTSFSYQR
jgi:hypothetical protein